MDSLDLLNATIAELERDFPALANSSIPSGQTRFWILALDPQPSLFDDTPFSSLEEIPLQISVRDDLLLIRNLLRDRSESALLEEMLKLSRVPGDHITVNAPDLGSALKKLVQRVSIENAPFSTELTIVGQTAQVAISVHSALRPLKSFFELVIGIALYRLMRSFLEFRPDTANALSSIRFLTTNQDEKTLARLEKLMGVRLNFSPDLAMVELPVDLLSATNPSHDPDLWRLAAEQSGGEVRFLIGQIDIVEVEEAILDHLLKFKRSPQLPELSKAFGVSERTFLRKLSAHGQTLRKLTSKIRQLLAEEMMQDPSRSIAEVSERLGYSEPSSLVRSFRAWHGLSPRQWRQKQV